MLRAYRYVGGKHDQLIRQRFIRQWYSLLDNQSLSRFEFKKKQNRRILRAHFRILEEYRDKKVKFRDGMKRLLKMRAKNLMRRAYVRGLKLIWHQKVIEINMWKAYAYFYRSKLLKKPFGAIARRVKAKKNGKVAIQQHLTFLQRIYMKKWLRRYLSNDIAQRYQKRRQTIIKFEIFNYFANTCRKNKSLLHRLEKFEWIHKFYLK